MKIEDHNNIAILKECSKREYLKLDKLLAVKSDAPWYNPAYKKGYWDGKYRFITNTRKGGATTSSFPSGFLSVVKKSFKTAEIVNISNGLQRNDWTTQENVCKTLPYELREHQQLALDACYDNHRGIIEIPTAGGKSTVIALLTAAIPGKCLVLAHTKDLVNQLASEIDKLTSDKPRKFTGTSKQIGRVTIGTIQSVRTHPELFEDFDAVIVDECHRVSSDSYFKFLLGNKAYYRYGFSADAFDMHTVKQDCNYKAARIRACLGDVIYTESTRNLKAKDYVASPKIQVYKIQGTTVTHTGSKYSDVYCSYYCNNDKLSKAVCKLIETHPGKSVLVLFKHIHHGQNLTSMMDSKGISHTRLSGEESSSQEITRAKDSFIAGGTKILVASGIFNEGTDLPNLEVLINAAGDIAATKQRIGRGMRKKKEGSNEVIVYDFMVTGNDIIEEHCKERIRVMLREGHDVQ